MNIENSNEVLATLLQKAKYRFQVLCFHVWIPDYFNAQLEHCKVCRKIRKKKIVE